jgi:hypothetical protein
VAVSTYRTGDRHESGEEAVAREDQVVRVVLGRREAREGGHEHRARGGGAGGQGRGNGGLMCNITAGDVYVFISQRGGRKEKVRS